MTKTSWLKRDEQGRDFLQRPDGVIVEIPQDDAQRLRNAHRALQDTYRAMTDARQDLADLQRDLDKKYFDKETANLR